jgi:UDP-2,3-diacylglucosamine pyrophosphatase LpxH
VYVDFDGQNKAKKMLKVKSKTLLTVIELFPRIRDKLAQYMDKKKKKQRKKTHDDAEKIMEENKAYSTRELEEDF